eukprot:TRINITY_DN12326_c0_g1_i1.p1 TRINITY_DN12326_c0_g1~~TRINITY_DN12326_c0_g1_i1.p1  ORF type:complete len:159 (+),score=29.28 TRINITY_DN12326_c0_g1_i1:28-477(+)
MLRATACRLSGVGHVVNSLRVKKGRKQLEVGFSGDEVKHILLAEYLRVHTTSADAVGHHESQKKLVFGKKGVTIENMWQVGNYAVTVEFSDGHKTGIYGWDYLHELSVNKYSRMRQYLKQMKEEGRDRVPRSTGLPSLASKVAQKLRNK